MSKKTYEYWVHDEEDGYSIESTYTTADARWIAQDCAKDYHSNHDGWESSWPLTINVKGIGAFTVERDIEPVFYAVPVRPAPTGQPGEVER